MTEQQINKTNITNSIPTNAIPVQPPLKHKKPKFRTRFVRFVRNFFIFFFIISLGWVVLARFIPVFVTPLILIRSVESISQGKFPKISKSWVSIEDISPNMVQSVVASEDNLFLSHHGFSFNDINRAIIHNQRGKRIRGGSTISQQTAKNVFLWPQRSYLRKGLEAYFTVLIEFIWTKERIMEVYLNVIEMGDGIYGVQAASEEYFGENASELSRTQAARIAACLPNPRRFNAGNPSGYIQRRSSKILSIMGKIGPVDFNKKVTVKKHKRHRR